MSQQITEAARDVFWIRDTASGKFLFLSPAFESIWGFDGAEVLDDPRRWSDSIHPEDRARALAVADAGGGEEVEYRIRRPDGSLRAILSRRYTVAGAPGIAGRTLGVDEDITRRRELEESLVRAARYDPLTGLPNRAHLLEAVDHNLRLAAVDPRHGFALLSFDLDRFNVINDGLGYASGDEILRIAAGRLSAGLKAGQLAARIGGDEFAVLIEGMNRPEEARRTAAEIQAAIAQPIQVQSHAAILSASAGIVVAASAYRHPEEILRDSGMALAEAMQQGLGGVQVFDRSMHQRAREQLQLEVELRRAIQAGQFEIHYQPIRTLPCGRLLGLEALLRWHHPDRGLLRPGEFLAVAEESGELRTIGWWVLENACRQMADWVRRGVVPERATVGVNLAPDQFTEPGLVDRVRAILEATGLAPDRLQIELPETLIMGHAEQAAEKLRSLRSLGVSIALDDFGTGHSSLSRLASLPIDALKIDQSFIAVLGSGGSHNRIVQAMIHLAQDLKLTVIAEGVQEEGQAQALREMGCDAVQGMMFVPPLPAAHAEAAVTGYPISLGRPGWGGPGLC